MAFACPSCDHILVGPETGYRIPAWCPRCGSDLKGPTRAQKLGEKAQDEKWTEKWGEKWGGTPPRAPTPSDPAAAPAAGPGPTPAPAVTLRPKVSLVPRAPEAEAQPADAVTDQEPLPVLQPVAHPERREDRRHADEDTGPDIRRPLPATYLPQFHVRVTTFWNWSPTIHRVYVSGRDFLFVHLGVNTLDPDEMARRAAWSMGGGLLPALIGYFAAQRARAKLDRIRRSLEHADEDVLREFAAEDPGSCILSVDDLDAVSLEGASFWRKLFSAGCSSLLTWTHPKRGKMTMELLSVQDSTVAVGEVKRLFGERARVNVSWDAL
jgi:hypothetical protein